MINIPIFLSSDNNYAPFVATTIASICDNTKAFCDFYILDGGITEENKVKICELKKKFFNFSIEFIKISDAMLPVSNYKNFAQHVSLATYNRFLISLLKPTLGKVIYLDVDIIAFGDIVNLYNENLNGFFIGAVPENFTNKYDRANINERSLVLGLLPSHEYFNAGVLLIDVQQWVKNNISEKLFQTELAYKNKLKFADQDVLNIYFNDRYKKLNEKYNYMTQKYSEYNDIIIRHYTTILKPWQVEESLETDLLLNLKNFWDYAKRTPFYEKLKSMVLYKSNMELLKFKVTKLLRAK